MFEQGHDREGKNVNNLSGKYLIFLSTPAVFFLLSSLKALLLTEVYLCGESIVDAKLKRERGVDPGDVVLLSNMYP